MRAKKKQILAAVITNALCLTAGLSVLYTEKPHSISPSAVDTLPEIIDVVVSGKTVLSDQMLICLAWPPSLEGNVAYCDLTIIGQITDIKETYIDRTTGTKLDEKLKAENGGSLPSTPVTIYKIRIDQTIIGNAQAKELVYMEHGLLGDMITKPEGKERVLLFLSKLDNGDYTTVSLEHSIFTVDDSDRLYSYSNRKALAAYDGKEVAELITDVMNLSQEG